MNRSVVCMGVLAVCVSGVGAHWACGGVLVLRNGHVLEGTVDLHGEHYVIDLKDGGQVRIPRLDVEFVSRDLTAAYRRKASRVTRKDFDGQLLLATWCIQHQLSDQAMEHLQAAERIQPGDTRIEVLRRRLAEPPAEVKLVAHQPVSAADTIKPDIGPQAMRQFVSAIQPMLVRSCAAAGCHGGKNGGNFQLTRSAKGGHATQRITYHNIQAILRHTDLKKPEQSRLLLKAREPHGLPERMSAKVTRQNWRVNSQLLEQWLIEVANMQASEPAIVGSTSRLKVPKPVRLPPVIGQSIPDFPERILGPQQFPPRAEMEASADEVQMLDPVSLGRAMSETEPSP